MTRDKTTIYVKDCVRKELTELAMADNRSFSNFLIDSAYRRKKEILKRSKNEVND